MKYIGVISYRKFSIYNFCLLFYSHLIYNVQWTKTTSYISKDQKTENHWYELITHASIKIGSLIT